MTNDGFYLKDADESDDEEEKKDEIDSYSSEYASDAEDNDQSINKRKNQGRNKQAPRIAAEKLNATAGNKKKSLAQEGTEKTMGLSNTVSTSLKQVEDKLDKNRIRKRDKADRATVDDCLNDYTMSIMDKLLNNEDPSLRKLDEFGGCIATGKEANVYIAHGSWDFKSRKPFEPDEDYNIPVKDYAVKIFKTAVLTFKDRERYV